jgi:AcrR family transcriptional regulator
MPPLAAARGGSTVPLYRKLRPRPNGPPREQIVTNQRTRLCGAIIEAAAVDGYMDTSVAQVCRLAGVSKRTFYEQFENKQACFLASYERVQGCAHARMAAAQESAPSWEQGLHAGLGTLVQGLAEQPHAAKLALVELDAVGPAALFARQEVRSAFERSIAASFDRAAHRTPLPPALAKGIVCGIERTLRRRVVAGAGGAADALTRELAAWALSYSSAALAELPAAALQRGDLTERSPTRARAGGERARIRRAAAEILAGDGHARLDASRIARRARVREEAVWACYDSVEQCFLDAVDLVGLEALVYVGRAYRAGGEGPAGVCRAITELVVRVAEEPVLRRIVFTQVALAGPPAIERRERLLDAFADLLIRGLARAQRPSPVAADAAVAAIWGLIDHHVARGVTQLLPGLAAYAAYLALAPSVGAEQALETILGEWGPAACGSRRPAPAR